MLETATRIKENGDLSIELEETEKTREELIQTIQTNLLVTKADLQKKLGAAEVSLKRILQKEERLSIDNSIADTNDSIAFLSKAVSTLRKCLEKVEKALRALEQGNYGFCENGNCGRPIEWERLIVQPFATCCHACKTEIEIAELRMNGRKRFRPF